MKKTVLAVLAVFSINFMAEAMRDTADEILLNKSSILSGVKDGVFEFESEKTVVFPEPLEMPEIALSIKSPRMRIEENLYFRDIKLNVTNAGLDNVTKIFAANGSVICEVAGNFVNAFIICASENILVKSTNFFSTGFIKTFTGDIDIRTSGDSIFIGAQLLAGRNSKINAKGRISVLPYSRINFQ
jgi:hypothetical protein